MASTTPSTQEVGVAVLLDMFPPSSTHTTNNHNGQHLSVVSNFLHNDVNNFEIVRMYILTSSKSNGDLTSSDDVRNRLEKAGANLEKLVITVLTTDDTIRAFYEAKQALDAEEICDVRVFCDQSQQAYWTIVCQLLFTPVYNWKVVNFSDSVETSELDLFSAEQDRARPDGLALSSSAVNNISSTTDNNKNSSNAKSTTAETDQYGSLYDKVRASIQNFLTTLPSLLGEPEVNRTWVIPKSQFVHGYSTRRGGVTSIPPMSAMNLVYTVKKRDSRLVVEENRRRLAQVGGFDHTQFHIVRTEHGHRVWVVGQDQPPQFDGLITNRPDITIAAAGADCIPLLFADPVKMATGAAHAGWRGTVEEVAACVVQAMAREFGSKPEDIRVAMGPCVLPGCFGLLPDEAQRFADIDPSCVVPKAAYGTHKVEKNGKQGEVNVSLASKENGEKPEEVRWSKKPEVEGSGKNRRFSPLPATAGVSPNISAATSQKSSINRSDSSINGADEEPNFSMAENSAKLDLEPQRKVAKVEKVAVDLVKANRVILEREGVLSEHIDTSNSLCTRCNPHLFFSHERDGFPFGNQIGFICMPSQ